MSAHRPRRELAARPSCPEQGPRPRRRRRGATRRRWIDIGAGAWDSQRRPSEVRLDRIVRIDPAHSAARRRRSSRDRCSTGSRARFRACITGRLGSVCALRAARRPSTPTHSLRNHVANIKSKIKRIGTNEKSRSAQRRCKSELKTHVRKVREAIASGDKDRRADRAAARVGQARQGRLQGRHPPEPGREPQVGARQAGRGSLVDIHTCAPTR